VAATLLATLRSLPSAWREAFRGAAAEACKALPLALEASLALPARAAQDVGVWVALGGLQFVGEEVAGICPKPQRPFAAAPAEAAAAAGGGGSSSSRCLCC
jgi:hypothetical protein